MKMIRLMLEKARLEKAKQEEMNCFLLADVQSLLFTEVIWEVLVF